MNINSWSNISYSSSRRCVLNSSLRLESDGSSRSRDYLLLYYWLCLSNWNWRKLMFMRGCENLGLNGRCSVSYSSWLSNSSYLLSYRWNHRLSNSGYKLTSGSNISRNFILSLWYVLIGSGFINVIIQLFNRLWWHNWWCVILSRFSFNFDSFKFIFISSLNLSLRSFKITNFLIL
jgi:hypothetical protein